MRIYVASSWRNEERQQAVVARLRKDGHDVYDFRHPAPGDDGFHWSEIDPDYIEWSAEEYRTALQHHIADGGFGRDMGALKACDACVLVLPCGRSAHIEAGWAVGAGKKTAILLDDQPEPELMYKMADAICLSIEDVANWVKSLRTGSLRDAVKRMAEKQFEPQRRR